MADGKVVFQIDGDARGVKTTIKDVTNDIEKESKKWDKAAEQSTGNIEGFFGGMLKGIVVAISAAGISKLILDWGKAAISAASDLAEVQNVVDVTFGDSARKIDAWAKSAGNNFGFTETQAKRYASTIGAMLKSQGTAQEDVLEMSESLAGLAADMASFYNLDFDTAFEKIRAGITGETMPLKQLGINMSVANLEAFALEKGIKKSYSAMSQGEQTMLRYQYLMKATADAQGDFARTSDSMANASRRVQASLETIKTKGGELLMTVIEPLTSGLANLLDKLTEEPPRTVLDDFAEIDEDYAQKLGRLQETADKAHDIINVMRDLEAQTVSLSNGQFTGLASIFDEIANIERNGGNGRDYIKNLGLDVESTYRQYQVWNESVKQLTSSIPSLTDVINAETGAIDGGTAAIEQNVDAFIAGEEKKYAWAAYYAKARALEEAKGSMYMYEFEAGAAEEALKRTMKKLSDEYGVIFDNNYIVQNLAELADKYGAVIDETTGAITDKGAANGYNNAIAAYNQAMVRYRSAMSELNRQTTAYTAAEKELADGMQYLLEKYGEYTEQTAENEGGGLGAALDRIAEKAKELRETGEYASKKLTEAADKQIANLKKVSDALQSVKDYADRMRDATESALSNVVKGFDTIERPTTELEKKRDRLIEQQNELNRATADGEQQYQRLEEQINDINKSLDVYTTNGMKDALSSQLTFLNEYLANLEKAQQMGLSDSLLASLSDGSVQSAEYLSVLVADPEQAKEIDKLYQQVTAKKEELTDALTEQKLSADEVFSGLVETAQNTIDELDLGDEAKTAMKNIVDGLTTGIYDNIGDFDAALSTIIGDVSSMIGTFESMKIGFGNIGISSGSILDGTHETGLDYVPFDNYLASLHEGEGILTAEENRIWQRFKNGAQPQTMDYDALGATMRENVHAGGNVYLDGATVGRVISDAQGNSYRQLERSGWQQ